ncbi:MAG: hypothetical protein LIQ31_13430 [Planctomycetes bacterium]|nr:hypothetical protein [Planctomycetota bacterium]
MAEKAENATPTGPAHSAPKTEERTLGHAMAERADKLKYIVLAVIVIVLAAIAIVNYMRRAAVEREIAARNDVFRTVIDVSTKPEVDAPAVLAEAARKYSGTPAGASASMFQFAGAFNSDNYPAAEQAARDFIRTYPENELVPRARLALGQSLVMQDKLTEAAGIFRELAAMNDPATFPEAKLALAQTLEKEAEAARDDPEEYRRRLELAEAEYNDIAVRSRIASPAQRGFWPQVVMLSADFALVKIKDTLAGHSFGTPTTMRATAPAASQAVTDEERQAVMAITPPAPGEAGTQAAVDDAAGDADAEPAETVIITEDPEVPAAAEAPVSEAAAAAEPAESAEAGDSATEEPAANANAAPAEPAAPAPSEAAPEAAPDAAANTDASEAPASGDTESEAPTATEPAAEEPATEANGDETVSAADGSVVEQVSVMARSAVDVVAATASSAGAAISDAARVAAEQVSEVAGTVRERASSAAATTWDAAGDAARRAKGGAKDVAESASEKASEAGEYIADAAGRAAAFAGKTTDRVVESVRSGVESLSGSDEPVEVEIEEQATEVEWVSQ